MMLLDFYADGNLQVGKEIIDASLDGEASKYISTFRDVRLDIPADNDRSILARFNRRLLAYRALLFRAGFTPPATLRPRTTGLFKADLLAAMRSSQAADPDEVQNYQYAARMLASQVPSWDQVADAFRYLSQFVTKRDSGYQTFNQQYMQTSTSGAWADADLMKILAMFDYANGPRLLGRVRDQHSPDVDGDYSEVIYRDLVAGRLVIIDQSTGDPTLNRSAAERIMWSVFRGNQEVFRRAQRPPSILVYVEEAHNLLPPSEETNTQNVWVRTAKEGAKYRIGMVYATQEVSSIQKNILKNTANWFIGHLNNTDETRELCKYYDFSDFESSIRRAQDRGFLRVKTLSNLFVVPVQVDRFTS